MRWKRPSCFNAAAFFLALLALSADIAPSAAAEPGAPLDLAADDVPVRNPLFKENVRLAAVMAEGLPELTGGLTWKILKSTDPEDDEAQPETIWTGNDAAPELKLGPGMYTAEVSYGLAADAMNFEVKPAGKLDLDVPVNAATLRVHAVAASGAPKLDGMFFALSKTAPDGAQDLVRSSLSESVFHVSPGSYRLTAHHGLASAEENLTVEAGEIRAVEIEMGMGQVALSAHAVEGGPILPDVTFFVFDAGEAGQKRELIRSKLEQPSFSLPAGDYTIAAVLGMARLEQPLTVKPGDAITKPLVLNGGTIKLASRLDGGDEDLEGNILYRIYGIAGSDKAGQKGELLRSTVPSPSIFLPEGRYRVESQYGWHNARQTREIEIRAGNSVDNRFVHKAANIHLRLIGKTRDQPVYPVKWTLKFNGAGTVLITQDAEPKLVLQEGSYQVIAQNGSKAFTKNFEAKSNKDQIIELKTE